MTQEMTQAEIDKMTPLGWTKETVYPKPDATPRTQLKNEETAAITEELFVFLTDGGDTFNEQQALLKLTTCVINVTAICCLV